MPQQNSNPEVIEPVPTEQVNATTQTQHCYIVLRTDHEPPDDDDNVTDGYWEFTISVVTAKSKDAAIAGRVKRLVARGYREVEVDQRMNDDLPEWTDEWFNTTFEVFTHDEPEFWKNASWKEGQKALVKWAGKNGELANQILAHAKSGNDAEHLAIANNAAFVSAVEKWNIATAVPIGTLIKEPGEPIRL